MTNDALKPSKKITSPENRLRKGTAKVWYVKMPLRIPRRCRDVIIVDPSLTVTCDLPKQFFGDGTVRSMEARVQLVPVGHPLFRRYSSRRIKATNSMRELFTSARIKLFYSSQWDDTNYPGLTYDTSIQRDHWTVMTRLLGVLLLRSPSTALNMNLAVPVAKSSAKTRKTADEKSAQRGSSKQSTKSSRDKHPPKPHSKRTHESVHDKEYQPQVEKKAKTSAASDDEVAVEAVSALVSRSANSEVINTFKKVGGKRWRSESRQGANVAGPRLTRQSAAKTGHRLEFSKEYGAVLADEKEIEHIPAKPPRASKSLAEPCLLETPLPGTCCSR